MRSCLRRFDIKGFQEITLIDWEGRIASNIFLGECNFRCSFCHSRSLVLESQQLQSINFERIERFLKDKGEWVDGVVITGGEPTLDEARLSSLISAVKNLGLLIKLDTNGTRPEVLRRLIHSKRIDYVAMDIKAPLTEVRYRQATDVDVNIEDIISSKNILLDSDIDYEFRTTVVPGIISVSDIAEIARSLIPAKRYCLQQFLPRDTIDPSFLKVKPYPVEELHRMAALASEHLTNVRVREN